jgi:hypothetical protein
VPPARQFAAGAEHVDALAPRLAMLLGEEEHRPPGAHQAGAVQQTGRPQRGVDRRDVEGVQRLGSRRRRRARQRQ